MNSTSAGERTGAASHARAYRWITAVLVLGALVATSRALGEERRFAEIVRNAEPWWLAVVVGLQVATYPCLAWAWSTAITNAGARPPPISKLVRISLAELFTDQALPSVGISGTLVVVAALERHRVPPRGSAAAVVTSLLGFYAAQVVAVVLAIGSLLARHRFVHFAAVVSVLAAIASAAIPGVVIAIAAGALPKLPPRIQQLRAVAALSDAIATAPAEVIFSPRTLGPVALMRLAIIALDSATLAAGMAAVGHAVPLDVAFAAFVLAYVVGSISFLPGGLGSFEAIAAGLLAVYRAPIEAAVTAIFLMRGFSFWLPMLPGLWFARRELGTSGAKLGEPHPKRAVDASA